MNITKSKLRKMLYVYAALMLILIFSSNTIFNFSLPKVAVAMPMSGKLTKELEVRGVMAFSEITEIYADSSGRINDILIKKGDYIDENTLIATYQEDKASADTTAADLRLVVERIENQIAALTLNKSFIQEKILALSVASADDLYVYQSSVEDAKIALEKRKAELLEAQKLAGAFSGDFEYQQAIADAERQWDRLKAELEEAVAVLEAALAATGRLPSSPTGEVEAAGVAVDDGRLPSSPTEAALATEEAEVASTATEEINTAPAGAGRLPSSPTGADVRSEGAKKGDVTLFDDYEYCQDIIDASIALERKKTELADAEAALAAAIDGRSAAFDSYAYDNAINAAQTAYDRSLEDYGGALRLYDLAVWHYDNLINAGVDESEIGLAQKSVDDAQTRVTLTIRALDDASEALNTAINDMVRAESAFYANIEKSITDAEQQKIFAEYAVADARRVYDIAVDELDRAREAYYTNLYDAQQKAIDDAKKDAETAQRLTDDAEWLYNKTVAARDEAAGVESQSSRKNIIDAENNLTDAQTALLRAEANYDMAQKALFDQTGDTRKSLNFESQKADLDIARANLDLHAAEAALADAIGNDLDAGIIAECSGIVLSVEINKGQFVSRGESIASVGVDNNKFAIEFSCQEPDGRFIHVGDEASVHVNGAASGIKATVRGIIPIGDMLNISLTCETEEPIGGEYVTVRFYKQTETYETIVPNEAVVRETAGSFVWVVRSRQGALGTEYYSVRVKVLIADMDEYYIAISRGMDFFEPVAVNYNKDLTLNGRVNRME